jgi:signal transduction histidine kinase
MGAIGFYLYMRHSLFVTAGAVNDLAVLSVLETVDVGGGQIVVREREFREELNELRQTLGLELVQLWSNGQLIARDSRIAQQVSSSGPAQEFILVNGHRMLVHRSHVGDTGMIVVGRQEELLVRELEALLRGLLLIVPLTVVLALGAGWFMAGQSIRPVRKAFDEQRTFMADASHELRTPLAIVLTQAEVALDGADDSGATERLRAALMVVARTARQMGRLVDDLLFLSRADATGLSPKVRPFPVGPFLEEVVESFFPLAKQKGMDLVVLLPSPEINIVADPDQLQRLVGVLVDNALQYGAAGKVEIKAASLGKEITIEVIDEGPGMADDFLPRAFDRFVRGDVARSRSIEGSGLGLSIARSICEAHGGTIELMSALHQGTRVLIRLPAAPAA